MATVRRIVVKRGEMFGDAEGEKGALSCALVESEIYRETLWLKAIPALPNLVELGIHTQLLNAKCPEELRTKSRTCLDLDSLRELHSVIGQFLNAQ